MDRNHQPIKCLAGCGDDVKREEMDRHIEHVCPNGEVACPYKVVGCGVGKLIRRDLDTHVGDNHVIHQQLMLKKLTESNEQRRKIKKVDGLGIVWIVIAIIVLGMSMFVYFQIQNNNRMLTHQCMKESGSSNDIMLSLENIEKKTEVKLENLEITIKYFEKELFDLKSKIESRMNNSKTFVTSEISILSDKTDLEFTKLEGNLKRNLSDLEKLIENNSKTLIDEVILALEMKMETKLRNDISENLPDLKFANGNNQKDLRELTSEMSDVKDEIRALRARNWTREEFENKIGNLIKLLILLFVAGLGYGLSIYILVSAKSFFSDNSFLFVFVLVVNIALIIVFVVGHEFIFKNWDFFIFRVIAGFVSGFWFGFMCIFVILIRDWYEGH